ncbi:uncharacterized protein LOC123402764 isoform X2 [Hordeum vulgare subsp. vulgare]|uniref:uncharacterized protein LOC123402764 isoform X2 n=1 Tax=Hordeum vulgare subsp. vulgare TaxID=112509 RepID=UPI001D1A33C9|nr:uncharacterized protein LOC123402764 isoform X2 [Hordeum vulgare subsp. vulgare]
MSPAAATREQATVIANSTNFRVQSYYGDGKNPRDHGDWETEMGESEVRFARHSPCRLITMIFQLGKCCRELFSVTTASTPTVSRTARSRTWSTSSSRRRCNCREGGVQRHGSFFTQRGRRRVEASQKDS